MDSLEKIGKRARSSRKALGLSQVDVCRRLGVNPPTWNNFERGRRLLRYPVLVAFCDEFGVTLDWLFRNEPSGLPHHLAQKIMSAQQPTSPSAPLSMESRAWLSLINEMTPEQQKKARKRIDEIAQSGTSLVVDGDVKHKSTA